MSRTINVHLLPDLVESQQLAGRTVVVIDVLRATTTIAHALSAGAGEITPCLSVTEARRLAQEQGDDVLLGGERDGLKIDGFDLGNSPLEYTAEKVAGRKIIFTTTNGTRAMNHARGAARVLLGSFVNLSAVCDALPSHVELLCAGTHGKVSRDDALVAGAMVAKLTEGQEPSGNDQAHLVAEAWRAAVGESWDADSLAEQLRSTQAGKNVASIGHDADIVAAAQIDKFDIAAELNLATGRIAVA